jgi:hypothetical protein
MDTPRSTYPAFSWADAGVCRKRSLKRTTRDFIDAFVRLPGLQKASLWPWSPNAHVWNAARSIAGSSAIWPNERHQRLPMTDDPGARARGQSLQTISSRATEAFRSQELRTKIRALNFQDFSDAKVWCEISTVSRYHLCLALAGGARAGFGSGASGCLPREPNLHHLRRINRHPL